MQTRSSSGGFDDIPEKVAAVVFSPLGRDPRDRARLAAVSKVWRDAEKSDASLPGTPEELRALGDRFYRLNEHKRAIYWWRKAADGGDADAMGMIGHGYFNGDGVERDETKAVEWFERASEGGQADATKVLALSYEMGVGVEVNEVRAIELYVKAEELGQEEAATELGNKYRYGTCGVAVDKKEALKWYRLAVELGDTSIDAEERVYNVEEEIRTGVSVADFDEDGYDTS